jgi:high-affinity K+ transport system ATPase subunit B
MHSQTKLNLLLALALLLAFVLACSGDETEKANKLVADGNTAITEGNKLATDFGPKLDKLFDDLSPSNYDADKEKVTPQAKEVVDGLSKAADKYSDASKKFDEASKLKVNDKFKEYLTLKSQEFSKRAEQMNVGKGNAQAILDSNDADSLRAKIKDSKTKSDKLEQESKDLEAKASKIQAENKDKIQ